LSQLDPLLCNHQPDDLCDGTGLGSREIRTEAIALRQARRVQIYVHVSSVLRAVGVGPAILGQLQNAANFPLLPKIFDFRPEQLQLIELLLGYKLPGPLRVDNGSKRNSFPEHSLYADI